MFGGLKKAFGYGEAHAGLSIYNSEAAALFGGVSTSSGIVVTSANAPSVPAVLHASRLISEANGSLPCKLYRKGADGTKTEAKDHPAHRLVHDRVNEWTTAGQLRVKLTADAIFHGAGYAHVIRVGEDRPYALKRLSPTSVQRRFEDDGAPVYLVNDARGRQHRLSYRDVLHLPAFNDLSPVQAGRNAIALAMTLEKMGNQFFGSGARPAGILSNDTKQGGEVGAKAAENMRHSHREWQNGERDVLILDNGWKYQQPAMTSTDAQFIENRVEQVREIARIFGVPPTMLFDLSNGSYSNTEQMAASFLQVCLRPWLDRWQDAYDTVLLTEAEQRDHYFEFVIDDLLRADAASRTTNTATLIAHRVMVPNEARAILNLPPLPGGDELANPHITPGSPAKDAA